MPYDLPVPSSPSRSTLMSESDSIRIRGNVPLPVSYRQFIADYGFGRSMGLILVYHCVADEPDSLFSEGEVVSSYIAEALAEEYLEFEPDGSPEIAAALYPFAMSENGEYFAWDVRIAGDEYPIYCIGARMGSIRYAGPDWFGVVRALTSDGIKDVMGTGYDALPATFEPLGRS